MIKWKNCINEFPRKRKNNDWYSEVVLTYDSGDNTCYSLAYYDFIKGEWYDVSVHCYLDNKDNTTIWCYPPKPKKRIKIRLEKIDNAIHLIIKKELKGDSVFFDKIKKVDINFMDLK
jgi:hypothetical protein